MLGEIEDLELKPSAHRGMTPRIFEFLFARIQAVILTNHINYLGQIFTCICCFLWYLISQEEESRRDEKLTYNCKCSFLEIYNEQITDLLDPASTNLLVSQFSKLQTSYFLAWKELLTMYIQMQLREDVKKGVYVENLSEFEVQTVTDILKLLTEVWCHFFHLSLSLSHSWTQSNQSPTLLHSGFLKSEGCSNKYE